MVVLSKTFHLRRRNLEDQEIHLLSGCLFHGHNQLAMEITVIFRNLLQHASQLTILIPHSLQFHLKYVQLVKAKDQISSLKKLIKPNKNLSFSELKSGCRKSPQFLVEYRDYHFLIFGFQYSRSADSIWSEKNKKKEKKWHTEISIGESAKFDHCKMQPRSTVIHISRWLLLQHQFEGRIRSCSPAHLADCVDYSWRRSPFPWWAASDPSD